MADQHLTPDQLVDLALGDVAEQQPLVRHLSSCLRCRAGYDEVSHAVDHALVAAPRVEPPPGFDRAVLDAMGMSDRPAEGRRRPDRARRTWLVAAAAAVVGVLLGVGGTVVATQGDGEPAGQAVLAGGTALRTSDGDRVGSIARSFVDGQPVIVVGVTDGPVGVHYECRLQLPGGRERVVGDWVLESGGATWVVPAPEDVEELELVTDTGTVWSSARM